MINQKLLATSIILFSFSCSDPITGLKRGWIWGAWDIEITNNSEDDHAVKVEIWEGTNNTGAAIRNKTLDMNQTKKFENFKSGKHFFLVTDMTNNIMAEKIIDIDADFLIDIFQWDDNISIEWGDY